MTIARSQNAPLVVSFRDERPETLRERFHKYGYLYFKGVLAKARCDALMESFIDILQTHVGFDKQSHTPVLTGEPFFETDPIFDVAYPDIQAVPLFQRIFHESPLIDLMKTVQNDEVFVYPMKMARISTPKKVGFETPPHQDAHSHQAPETMAGMWVALHDVKASMGRLMILPYSHKGGVRPVHEADGVGGVQCEIYEDETTWHVSDVSQGDVIIFHACCVHKAEPNTSPQTVRLSIDTRFCHYGAEVYTSNLAPHHGWRIEKLDWPYIYRQLDDKSLHYYWRNYPNLHGPSEESWRALAMGLTAG